MYFYDSNGILGPVEYRQKYEEILSQAPKSRTLQNPDKYLLSKRQLENFSDLAWKLFNPVYQTRKFQNISALGSARITT